jgi:hypothetical protein
MAFAYTVSGRENLGSINVIYGTYTNTDTDSGGSITTGMGLVAGFGVVPTGQVDMHMPKYSVSGGVVTLVTGNGDDGNWYAMGK